MRHPLMAVSLVGLLVTGCAIGPSPKSYLPAQGPAGAAMKLQTVRGAVHGELLVMGESELLLLVSPGYLAATRTTSRLVWVPIQLIQSALGPTPAIRGPGDWTTKRREGYRLLSRYPDGLTPVIERGLVVAYGGAAIERMQP